MTEQLFLKESTGFDSASQRPSDQTRSSIIDELFDLAASRNLDTMLSKAVGTVVRLFGAEAGSILFHGRSLYRVRSGAFRQEVLGRIQHWEDVIGKRLQTTSWRIAESAKLPISVSKLAKPQLILINTPLVANAGLVVGSLSLVLPPSSGLTEGQRHLLDRTSTGIGRSGNCSATPGANECFLQSGASVDVHPRR